MSQVYAVFYEMGEYEQYSRDLRGIFLDNALADEFSKALGDGAEVEAWDVLTEMPQEGTYYEIEGFLLSDGKFGKGLAAKRTESWPCWLHETERVSSGIEPCEPREPDAEYQRRVPENVDLIRSVVCVTASGWDKEAVREAFRRETKRARLAVSSSKGRDAGD